MRNRFAPQVALVALLTAFLSVTTTLADIKITLNDSFIEKYMNRATIDGCFHVDKAHRRPNSPSKDGDMHIAGRMDSVLLPMVAEMMNARSEQAAVDIIHGAEGSGTCIPMEGVWRVWCEHGGNKNFVQGEDGGPAKGTNPDHVFEVHPVTKVGDIGVPDSLRPIRGFRTKDAERAFANYERVHCRIEHDKDKQTTTITTRMAGYNYPEFIMELLSDPKEVEAGDGRMAFAAIYDLDDELLVRKRRMVFAKDTAPELIIRDHHAGDRLHVLGIPRVNLRLIHWRVEHAEDPLEDVPEELREEQREERREVLEWSLPYEIIVVGIYND